MKIIIPTRPAELFYDFSLTKFLVSHVRFRPRSNGGDYPSARSYYTALRAELINFQNFLHDNI